MHVMRGFNTARYSTQREVYNMKRKFGSILLISFLLAFVSVLGSTAYACKIFWIEYDDFETVSKSNNLWDLWTRNMCSDHNPYFDSGKMIQEAAVPWYNPTCSSDIYLNRVRSSASPLAAPYITGIGVRVMLDQLTGYDGNRIRGRLGAIFYNDGVLPNSGNGTDATSEVFVAMDIRPTEVRWYVSRLTDPDGVGGVDIAWGQLFLNYHFLPPPSPPNLKSVPFDFKLWFDGTKIYFSAEIERPSGEIIKAESTYTPVGQILPPKTPPLRRLESMIDMLYSPFPALDDQSYVKNEWDDVWVAVKATNLGAVKKIIHNASKRK
jgi:hypothetical protein